jgi:hypothetical protein
MSQRIEKLTPEQEAELPRFRQRYLNIVCGVSRIDRALLEAALAEAYAGIGKPAPKLVIFDSPKMCMKLFRKLLSSSRLRDPFSMNGQLNFKNFGQLRIMLCIQLWSLLSGQLEAQITRQLTDKLRVQLWDEFRDQGQLWDQHKVQLWGQFRGQGHLGNHLRRARIRQREEMLRQQETWNPDYLSGAHNLDWIAWGRFAEKIGVKFASETARNLGIIERILTQCEWWWLTKTSLLHRSAPQTSEEIMSDGCIAKQERLSFTLMALESHHGTGSLSLMLGWAVNHQLQAKRCTGGTWISALLLAKSSVGATSLANTMPRQSTIAVTLYGES